MPWVHFATIFVQEKAGKPACQRSFQGSGEGPVQVAPVRQVSRQGDKAENVHDRHSNKRAMKVLECAQFQEPPYDLHAGDLIAMNGRADEKSRSGLATTNHMDRHCHRRMGGKLRYRQVDCPAFPGLNDDTADGKGLRHGTSHVRVSWFCLVWHSSPGTR